MRCLTRPKRVRMTGRLFPRWLPSSSPLPMPAASPWLCLSWVAGNLAARLAAHLQAAGARSPVSSPHPPTPIQQAAAQWCSVHTTLTAPHHRLHSTPGGQRPCCAQHRLSMRVVGAAQQGEAGAWRAGRLVTTAAEDESVAWLNTQVFEEAHGLGALHMSGAAVTRARGCGTEAPSPSS